MIKKIIFHSKAAANYYSSNYLPDTVRKNIPEWYRKADKYKRKSDGLFLLEWFKKPNGDVDLHRIKSWKSCPAVLDTFTTGYYLFTPCDVIIKKVEGNYTVSFSGDWVNKEHSDINDNRSNFVFVGVRGEEYGFPTPPGYEDIHFFWTTNWFPTIPKGYTTLFTHPINRFDLDFLTISGIVDCESFNNAGRMPFFIKKGFEGVIPAGTPYTQIIPFKNEKWESEIMNYTPEDIKEKDIQEKLKTYKSEKPMHSQDSLYKEEFWMKKEYD